MSEKAKELVDFGKNMNQKSMLGDKKSLVVLLVLEGDFGSYSVSRSKKMIMNGIKNSIDSKLKWLKCRVEVVDSDTNRNHLFSIS